MQDLGPVKLFLLWQRHTCDLLKQKLTSNLTAVSFNELLIGDIRLAKVCQFVQLFKGHALAVKLWVNALRWGVDISLLKQSLSEGRCEERGQVFEAIEEVNGMEFPCSADVYQCDFVLWVSELQLVCNRQEGYELINVNGLVLVQIHLIHQICQLHLSEFHSQLIQCLLQFLLTQVIRLIQVCFFEQASELIQVVLKHDHFFLHLGQHQEVELLLLKESIAIPISQLHHFLCFFRCH